jgi:DNA polymerase-3 subunit beta
VATRHTIGILQCVRLTCHNHTVAIAATDLEIGAVVPVEAAATPSNFDVVIPLKEFEGILKASTNRLIWIDETAEPESYVMVADGTDQSTPVFAWIEPEHRFGDFPNLPTVEKVDQEVTVMVEQLQAALGVVLPSASRDDSRPVLTGIAIDVGEDDTSVTFVSTDSYRLHKATTQGVSTGERQLRLVPHRFLKLVSSYAKRAKRQTVTLRFGNGRCEASFDQDQAVILGRLIDGQFPRYQQLIPDSMEFLAGFDAEQLLIGIKQVEALRATKIEPAVLHLADDGWYVSELNQKGSIALTKANAGPWPEVGFAIGFNPEFLASAIKAMADESVIIEFQTPLRPAVVSAKSSSDRMALLMPVRLSVTHFLPKVEQDVATKVTYSGKTKGAKAVTKAVNAAMDKGAEPVVEQRPTGVNSPSNQFLIEANLAMANHYRVTDLKMGPEREEKELQRSYHNGLVAWYLGKRKTRPDAGALAPAKASVVKARVTRIGQKHGIQAPGA